MDPYERSQLADALKSMQFKEGETVLREGEEGNEFFIVEQGTANATKQLNESGDPVVVSEYTVGGYFGELALIKNEPRAANIIATSDLSCVCLDRHSFKRLLGPVENILQRNAQKYEEIMKEMRGE
mmetsp:Transcript_21499/g.3501  ORF Transcript_21499/g.3501 Transcript_21499/m.3501 type:complete len:126 (-) Transcript_21499:850-1227(-)